MNNLVRHTSRELLFELCCVLSVLMLLFIGGDAQASSITGGLRDQMDGRASSVSFQKGDILARLRIAVVNPDESSTVTPIGGSTHVSTEVLPEVDVTYFLTDHLAVEAVVGIIRHKLKIQDTVLGDIDAGHSTAIAPTLVLQYHREIFEGVKPYLGAGISYVYYIADNDDADIEYTDDVAPVLQAGVDVAVAPDWYANVDMKKAFVTTISSRPGSPLVTETNVDPWVFSAGVGYRF